MDRANCGDDDEDCFWDPNGDDNVNSAYMTLNYVATSVWDYEDDQADFEAKERLAYNQ